MAASFLSALISHTPVVLASLAQPPKLVMKVLRMILVSAQWIVHSRY